MKLIHKGCGGELEEDPSRGVYDYASDDSKPDRIMQIPALICQKCDEEILGDAMIEFDPPLEH